jgi:glycolate oxidase subunit GlcD
MITDHLIEELGRIVGESHVLAGRAGTELYSYDASLAWGQPGVVVFPANTHEAAAIVRTANKAGISFVPRGFGTNLSGGTVLPDKGIVICLSRFNRILGIFPHSRHAVVQPGVTNLELQNALADLNFFYAPDPASQKVATLGGNIGENSGGPRCLKYGVTTNHVLGMEMILANGEIIRTGGTALDPPGYDLRGAMVGSEGTLAIVTEITVRILPTHEAIITMLAIYDDIVDAARSVSAIIGAGIVPTTLEMMDAPIIKAVEDSYACGYPRDAAAVLIIEVEGPAAGLEHQAMSIRELCTQNGCRKINEAQNDAERNRLWEGRRGAFGAVARLAPSYLVNDCSVSRTKLPEALARVTEISERYNIPHGNVFHAGDGNLHPLLLFDSRDEEQMKRVKKAGWEIMEACVRLGGTISGEHGIGVEKIEAMHMIFSREDLDFQQGLKDAFDPRNLLNPGKVIPKTNKGIQKLSPEDQQPAILSKVGSNGAALDSLIQRIQSAEDENRALLPVGCGSRQDFGNLSSVEPTPLESSGLDEIIEYDPQNQVVTVGAGMSLKKLQTELQNHNQWLPLRPIFSTMEHSLGGIAATAACGPERMVYGTVRDLLLGLRFINAKGQLISAGGRVVKNVAGYDITRLMVGSAGTLGLITELTLKVATITERCCALTAEGSLDACAGAAAEIIASNLWPTAIAAVQTVPTKAGQFSDNWQLSIGFEGIGKSVESQLDRTTGLLKNRSLRSIGMQNYDSIIGPFHAHYKELNRFNYLLRADVPLDQLMNFFVSARSSFSLHYPFLDFGNGRITLGLEEITNTAWLNVIDLSAKLDGHALMERAPDDFKQNNDVFGQPRPEWRLMHTLKNVLDPGNIFAPGRLPGRV